jgi:hypothetical protein
VCTHADLDHLLAVAQPARVERLEEGADVAINGSVDHRAEDEGAAALAHLESAVRQCARTVKDVGGECTDWGAGGGGECTDWGAAGGGECTDWGAGAGGECTDRGAGAGDECTAVEA